MGNDQQQFEEEWEDHIYDQFVNQETKELSDAE